MLFESDSNYPAVAAETVVMSWSGGKDSALALAQLRTQNGIDVVGLLTSVTRGYDRVSIHGVRRTLLEAQARSLDLPVYEIALEPNGSNEAYEAAFRSAVERVKAAHPSLSRIAFGDLFLSDVRAYREQLVASVDLEPIFPLWERDTRQLAEHFIDLGYRARLVCVDTTQLEAAFAGRPFDADLLKELPATVDPCGERGEFHTFVSDGPILAEPVACVTGEVVVRDGRFAYCDLIEAG